MRSSILAALLSILLAGCLSGCLSGDDEDEGSGIGKTWTDRVNAVGATGLVSLTWTGSQLVAVGPTGNVVTSPDGAVWTHHNIAKYYMLSSITWTGSKLVAVGYNYQNDSDFAFTSTDGSAWTVHNLGRAKSRISFVTWGNDESPGPTAGKNPPP